jgi:hypothetical protein
VRNCALFYVLCATVPQIDNALVKGVDFFSSFLDAKDYFLAADVNNDGVLTFAEFAWKLANSFENIGNCVEKPVVAVLIDSK